MLPPEPMLETGFSLGLWELVEDQVRVSGFGQPYALDLAAVSSIFADLDVPNRELEIRKMKVIFQEIYRKGKK